MPNEKPAKKPTTPPVPPAPPVPPVPPAPAAPTSPQWGEYATPAAQAAATIPGAAPVPPMTPAPPTGPPAPAYVPTGYPSAGYGAGFAAPAKPKRRIWDLVLTIVLFVLAIIGVLLALTYAWIFSSPELLSESLSTQGYDWNGDVGAFAPVIIISHLGLYLLMMGVTLPLLIRGRVVVFWIPLTIGVIAAIIFWASLFVVVLSDPNFVNSVQP